MTDLVVRGGTVVTPGGQQRADVAIEDGRIREVSPDITGGRLEIDARGLLVMPGLIDVHLHFNEPGRADWEGGATGSRALAAGGGTLFFDMPLNSTPCTVNVREFDRKRAALEASSITDFALWGGLVPGAVADMADMAERGVVGFKAFMCNSGLAEFPRADDMTLLDGLRSREARSAGRRPRRERGDHAGTGRANDGADVSRIPRFAASRRRTRSHPARAAAGEGSACPAAHRPRQLGPRRRDGCRGTGTRR